MQCAIDCITEKITYLRLVAESISETLKFRSVLNVSKKEKMLNSAYTMPHSIGYVKNIFL